MIRAEKMIGIYPENILGRPISYEFDGYCFFNIFNITGIRNFEKNGEKLSCIKVLDKENKFKIEEDIIIRRGTMATIKADEYENFIFSIVNGEK